MKNYQEIANTVFKKRDAYVAKQKKKRRRLLATVVPGVVGFVVLLIGLGLWQDGALDNDILVDTSPSSSNTVLSTPNHQNSTTSSHSSSSTSTTTNSQSSTTTAPSTSTTTQPSQSTTTEPSQTTPSDSSDTVPSNTAPDTPPSTGSDFCIDSFDKMNFYSAKKIIDEYSLSPFRVNSFSRPQVVRLNQSYVEYPIDRNKIFTITMVTYFMIELHDERGFLAQKLGGTGLVEVVVTQNDIDDMGYMITFKREENYFSCFINGGSGENEYGQASRRFSSHKYVDGFTFVKNLEQENYLFIVHYEGAKVVGFECQPFHCVPTKYTTDDVTFYDDICIVLFTTQHFTIDQLEVLFKDKYTEDIL